MLLCRRCRNRWRKSSGSSSPCLLLTSRLSKCPRSLLWTPFRTAAGGTVGGSADGLDVRLGSRGRADVGEAQSTGSVGAPCRQPRAGYKYWAGLRRGRPCDHLRQAPAGLRRVRGGASASVHRQYGGFPVASQRQVRTVQNCADGVRFHRCSSWGLSTCPLLS